MSIAVRNWPRLLIASAIGLALAVLCGLQTLSSVSTKKAPELAVSLFPANGQAREHLAFQQFTARMAELGGEDGSEFSPGDEAKAADDAVETAMLAIRTDPLAPKAYAILAMAQPDQNYRRAILDSAHRLNRRDLTLQGLVLQERLAQKDYPGTIETLDQILRVHPKYSREFFPVLTNALAEEETIPLFARLLDGSAPWHDRFLIHAVRQKDVLPNLAELRQKISIADERFDRALIAGLAAQGDIAGAQALVQQVSPSAGAQARKGVLDWRSTYPPFDWRFTDKPGFRAQASHDMKQLELSVRPGKGGVIAARLIEVPAATFGIHINHRIAPSDQLRDVRVQLICATNGELFFDERFSRQGDGFRVDTVPVDCEQMVLAINARAWSGRSALSGTVNQIRITPEGQAEG